jgi:hypothetical protein
VSIVFDFAKAMQGVHGALGPVITRRLRAGAPGDGEHHSEHVATITHRTSSTALQWVGAWTPWGFVIRRTKAHEILPTRSHGLLVFTGRDGSTVFARRVQHPGTTANRFPLRVWRESLTETRPIIKAGIRGGLTLKQLNPYRATLL